jgi:hypothetical protein
VFYLYKYQKRQLQKVSTNQLKQMPKKTRNSIGGSINLLKPSIWRKLMNDKPKEERTWTEEVEISGSELVDRAKELLQEGNVRRLIIRKPNDDILLEIPLTAGVAVGGVVTVFAPVLAALGALAALVANVKLQIVRVTDEGEG